MITTKRRITNRLTFGISSKIIKWGLKQAGQSTEPGGQSTDTGIRIVYPQGQSTDPDGQSTDLGDTKIVFLCQSTDHLVQSTDLIALAKLIVLFLISNFYRFVISDLSLSFIIFSDDFFFGIFVVIHF